MEGGEEEERKEVEGGERGEGETEVGREGVRRVGKETEEEEE